jgi:hypothetical protein
MHWGRAPVKAKQASSMVHQEHHAAQTHGCHSVARQNQTADTHIHSMLFCVLHHAGTCLVMDPVQWLGW